MTRVRIIEIETGKLNYNKLPQNDLGNITNAFCTAHNIAAFRAESQGLRAITERDTISCYAASNRE